MIRRCICPIYELKKILTINLAKKFKKLVHVDVYLIYLNIITVDLTFSTYYVENLFSLFTLLN